MAHPRGGLREQKRKRPGSCPGAADTGTEANDAVSGGNTVAARIPHGDRQTPVGNQETKSIDPQSETHLDRGGLSIQERRAVESVTLTRSRGQGTRVLVTIFAARESARTPTRSDENPQRTTERVDPPPEDASSRTHGRVAGRRSLARFPPRSGTGTEPPPTSRGGEAARATDQGIRTELRAAAKERVLLDAEHQADCAPADRTEQLQSGS